MIKNFKNWLTESRNELESPRTDLDTFNIFDGTLNMDYETLPN